MCEFSCITFNVLYSYSSLEIHNYIHTHFQTFPCSLDVTYLFSFHQAAVWLFVPSHTDSGCDRFFPVSLIHPHTQQHTASSLSRGFQALRHEHTDRDRIGVDGDDACRCEQSFKASENEQIVFIFMIKEENGTDWERALGQSASVHLVLE